MNPRFTSVRFGSCALPVRAVRFRLFMPFVRSQFVLFILFARFMRSTRFICVCVSGSCTQSVSYGTLYNMYIYIYISFIVCIYTYMYLYTSICECTVEALSRTTVVPAKVLSDLVGAPFLSCLGQFQGNNGRVG